MPENGLRATIETLLQSETDALALRYKLEQLAADDEAAFKALADVWADALFERDANVFSQFLTLHLDNTNSAVIEALLSKIQAAGMIGLFQALYHWISTPDRQRRDLEMLVASPLGDTTTLELLKARFTHYRNQQMYPISGKAALALYRRNAPVFSPFILENLTTNPGEYAALMDEAVEHNDGIFYWNVFSRTATAEVWERSLRDLLERDVPHDLIVVELNKRHPQQDYTMSDAIWHAFLDKYGDAIVPYLETHSRWYLRRRLDELLNAPLSNDELLQQLSPIAAKQSAAFTQMSDVWAMRLYDRDADYFESILRTYLRPIGYRAELLPSVRETIERILPRAEADAQDTLFAALYELVATEDRWNADLLRLAKSALQDDSVLAAIDRRKVPYTFGLQGTAALALYERNADLFEPFIITRVRAKSTRDNQLMEAARKNGHEALYWSQFRLWATPEDWQREIQALLYQDMPADQIAAELETRHPAETKDINSTALQPLLDKYGASVMPYLERHFNLVTADRIRALLALPLDRGTLLRELDGMANRERLAFRNLANVWALPLVEREPKFFEGFLVRNLDVAEAAVIHELLPRIEANGQESLFKSLYRKVTADDRWNYELQTFATSGLSDAEVAAAIERRAPRWGSMTEKSALMLYHRNADLFRDTIKRNLRSVGGYHHGEDPYAQLRQEAQAAGDEAFYWHLFHEFAPPTVWQHELEQLLARDISADQIAAELDKRLPEQANYLFKPVILLQFLDKYGVVVMPYVMRFVHHITQRNPQQMLEAVRKSGDEASYWQVFFTVGNSELWNEEIRKVLNSDLSDNDLASALQVRTPNAGEGRWNAYTLDPNRALALYQRNPDLFRPFIQRFMHHPTVEFFEAVLANDDSELLDLVVYRLMNKAAGLVPTAYPPERMWRWRQPDPKAQAQIAELGAAVTVYFDRLYAQSPEIYVRHAANIMAYFRAFEVWQIQSQMEHNPIFSYIASRYPETWQRSPDGIRELLESPNIYVQIMGIRFLNAENADTAQRIMENLYLFKALLLGRARRRTKRDVLACLEKAFQQGPDFAARIAPILEEAVDYQGKRAISDLIMVSLARAQYQSQSQSQHLAQMQLTPEVQP